MDFFEKYKKKMAKNNILFAILTLLLAGFFGAFAVYFICNGGLSLEADYAISAKGSRSGIPVPNIVLLIMLLGLTAGLLFAVIVLVKKAITNPQYAKFITSVEKIAPAALVGEQLSTLPRSKLAKGDLRFNERYFFYSAGDEILLLQTKDIRNIQPICEEGKYTHYYVMINGSAKEIRIETTKKYALPLAQSIQKAVISAQSTR